MMLRIVGIVLVMLILLGIYVAISDGGLHRCAYSEATHDTECYDPR